MDIALAVDGARLDQNLFCFAAVRAAIHAKRAADTAGDAAIEGETGDPGFGSGARDLDVGHGGPARSLCAVFDRDLAETAPEPDHDARDAAVANEKIGAEPDDGDRNVGRSCFRK